MRTHLDTPVTRGIQGKVQSSHLLCFVFLFYFIVFPLWLESLNTEGAIILIENDKQMDFKD